MEDKKLRRNRKILEVKTLEGNTHRMMVKTLTLGARKCLAPTNFFLKLHINCSTLIFYQNNLKKLQKS